MHLKLRLRPPSSANPPTNHLSTDFGFKPLPHFLSPIVLKVISVKITPTNKQATPLR